MAAPVFVQVVSAATFSATNTQSQTLPSAVTLGTHRFVIIRTSTASAIISSVVGSVSGAYTLLGSQANGASTTRTYLYYVENGAAGSETVTVTTTTTGNTIRWGVMEFSGCLASASADVNTSATFTTSTTPATGSITTTAADDLVIAAISTDSSATSIGPGGTETERFEVDIRLQVQTYAKAVAGSTSSSWALGATQPGAYLIAAFKADTGGGLPTPGFQQYQHRRSTLITL